MENVNDDKRTGTHVVGIVELRKSVDAASRKGEGREGDARGGTCSTGSRASESSEHGHGGQRSKQTRRRGVGEEGIYTATCPAQQSRNRRHPRINPRARRPRPWSDYSPATSSDTHRSFSSQSSPLRQPSPQLRAEACTQKDRIHRGDIRHLYARVLYSSSWTSGLAVCPPNTKRSFQTGL